MAPLSFFFSFHGLIGVPFFFPFFLESELYYDAVSRKLTSYKKYWNNDLNKNSFQMEKKERNERERGNAK